MGLTARQAATIAKPGFHAAGGVTGLYLQVTRGAGRSWVYRFQIAGRRRDMGLGPADVIGLAEARERAAAMRRMVVVDGCDPITARRADRAGKAVAAARSMTFVSVPRHISPRIAPAGSQRHAAQWATARKPTSTRYSAPSRSRRSMSVWC